MPGPKRPHPHDEGVFTRTLGVVEKRRLVAISQAGPSTSSPQTTTSISGHINHDSFYDETMSVDDPSLVPCISSPSSGDLREVPSPTETTWTPLTASSNTETAEKWNDSEEVEVCFGMVGSWNSLLVVMDAYVSIACQRASLSMEIFSNLHNFRFKTWSTHLETSFPSQRHNYPKFGNTGNRGLGQQYCEWYDRPQKGCIIRTIWHIRIPSDEADPEPRWDTWNTTWNTRLWTEKLFGTGWVSLVAIQSLSTRAHRPSILSVLQKPTRLLVGWRRGWYKF